MLSLANTQATADELYQPGAIPSIKLAFWGAALSPQKKLSWNIAQVRALLPYVSHPLPQDVNAVWHILRAGHAFISRQQAKSILGIERAEREGLLADLAKMPTTYAGWLQWRLAAVKLPGISYKTASFAALLLWPNECPLIPVDSHVCARLGVKELYKSIGNYKVYRWIERQVLHEWHKSGHRHDCSPAVWHWYKWSEWRQATGDEPITDFPESHAGLSPYVLRQAA
jgi:hypothetical protein